MRCRIGQLIETVFVTHPLHGMMVHFPIALSAAALLFVVLALRERSIGLERAAWYCMILVAATSVLAAFSGYRDLLVRFEGDAPWIPQKAFLGVTLILLSGALAFARARDEELLWNPRSMVLYVSGIAGTAALSAVLGFLGGVILYGF